MILRVTFDLCIMSAIDKLSEAQRTSLKKTSTEQLRINLIKAGVDGEQVLTWARQELLEAMADVVLKGGGATGGMATVDSDKAMRERELLLKERELQLKEAKEKRRLEEREADDKRRLEEAILAEKQREADDKRRLEEVVIAEKRWQDEMRLKQQELDRQSKLDESRLKEDKSIVGRTRKFAAAIKHVFPDFPNESVELPAFFDSLENLFQLYEIPMDLQSKLLIPRLSSKAKTIINKLSLADLDNYEKVKKYLQTSEATKLILCLQQGWKVC